MPILILYRTRSRYICSLYNPGVAKATVITAVKNGHTYFPLLTRRYDRSAGLLYGRRFF